MPVKKTIGKIRDHLTSIYRQFLKEGKLELYYDGEALRYEEPKILEAPNPRDPSGKLVTWRKPIDIRLGNKRVHGFVAIRDEAKLTEAGLALFRRNRLILGSGDEGYRPTSVFGQPNSYRYQRVFGELHLEGFGVSHTKDAIQWEDLEEEFLDQLRKQMDSDPLPILKMAEEYRARTRTTTIARAAEAAAASTAEALATASTLIDTQRHEVPLATPPPSDLPLAAEVAATKEFRLRFQDQEWTVTIDLANDNAISEWLYIAQNQRSAEVRLVGIRVNLAHPFMQRFAGTSGEQIEPLLRIASSLAVATVVSRDQGVLESGTIYKHVNEILRSALSGPIITSRPDENG
ncbi:MAG: hypothetical protein IPO05_03650 [Flavobacteriales bacterium]|nr:hypothetical protein [Flavobacteriales bacterium]